MSVLKLLKNVELDLGKDGKAPPAEFRIFPFGEIETSKGTFTFDTDCAVQVMDAYEEQGNELCLDYEHAMLEEPAPADGAPAAGWYKLELREDGLYAVDVRWTPRALEYLANKEYRYFSPAFAADEDGRILQLVNIALTNLPATKNQQALVAASSKHTALRAARDLRVATLSALSFAQIGDLLCDALRRALPDAYPYICDVYDDSVVYAVGNKIFQAPYSVEGNRAVLGDATEVQRTYTPVANDEEEMPMKTLLTALSLKPDASEAEALAALTRVQNFEREALALTGKTSSSEALGAIAALKDEHGQVAALKTELAELKARAVEGEVNALVEHALRDGKLTPARKQWALDLGKKDVAMLKGFLDTATPVPAATPPAREPEPGAKLPEGTPVQLSAEELAIAKQLKNDPKKLAELKANKAQA